MPEHVDIVAFRRRILPALEVEIRPDQSPLIAVINRPDGEQRGIDVRDGLNIFKYFSLTPSR